MGIFDSIRGFLNSEIIATYNDMVNNHTEAFRRWRGKQLVGTFSGLFDIQPTYSDKQYVANHKNDILAFEKIIAEEKAFQALLRTIPLEMKLSRDEAAKIYASYFEKDDKTLV